MHQALNDRCNTHVRGFVQQLNHKSRVDETQQLSPTYKQPQSDGVNQMFGFGNKKFNSMFHASAGPPWAFWEGVAT